jgi:16S rRNA (uracil1498-N3)-methyltransferase
MPRPRFFVPEAGSRAGMVPLPSDEAHHLLHVLRLGAGAEVSVFDGRGSEWVARVVEAGKRTGVTVELAEPIEPAAEPLVHATLAIGLLKGDRMNAAVRDATMLGAGVIAPFVSDHVAVPARAGRAAAPARWHRVAVASAKQCGRAVVPRIEPAEPLGRVLDRSPAELRLIFVEPAAVAGEVTRPEDLPRPRSVLALVGAEGGWSREEVQSARERGAVPVSLGARRLRADAAPVVVLSVLWTVWGW